MKLARRIFFSALSVILIFFISAFVFSPLPGYVPILMYHYVYPKANIGPESSSLNVSIEAFEKQMWFLKTFGYRTISMDEYYEIKTGKRKPRGKEVLITFDDGHRTYLTKAMPILERYQLKSTGFLVWRLLLKGGTDYINLNEVKNLSRNPLIDFQSHTMTHPNLTKVSLSRAKDEIFQSKEYLEKALGKEIKYFCYPEGSFNPDTAQLVQEAGYKMAFRTSLKYYKSYPEIPFAVVRIKISPKYNLFVFWLSVSGLAYYAKQIGNFYVYAKRAGIQLTLNFPNGKLNTYKPQYGTT